MLLGTVHCIWDENVSSACGSWTELKVKQWPPHCTGKHWIGVVVVDQRNTTGRKYNLRSPKPDKLKQSSIYLIHSGHGWVSQTLILEILFRACVLQTWTCQCGCGKLMDTGHLLPPQFPLFLINSQRERQLSSRVLQFKRMYLQQFGKKIVPKQFCKGKERTSPRKVTRYPEQGGFIQIPVHIKVEVILFSIPCFKVWVVLCSGIQQNVPVPFKFLLFNFPAFCKRPDSNFKD